MMGNMLRERDQQYIANRDEDTKTWYRDIIKGSSTVDNYYPFPPDMIKLRTISIKDTNDDKYKRIRRLVEPPVVVEDVSP